MGRRETVTLALMTIFLGCVPILGSHFLVDLTTEISIYVLFALSLNMLVGYAGNVSFGHAAYFAIGGYANAILLTTYEWPLWASIVAATTLSSCTAVAIGYFCIRLSDIYFAMLTLAFSMLVWAVAFKWRSVTGGDDGFVGVPLPSWLDNRIAIYHFVLGMVIGSTSVMWLICHSAFGRILVAVRENARRATFVGIDERRVRLVAFTIAGTFAGVSGALFSLYNRGMFTESAYWTESAQVLIMTLLGGIHSFFGPALGAATLYLLEVNISRYTEYWPLVLGGLLVIIVLFVPDGLIGIARRLRKP